MEKAINKEKKNKNVARIVIITIFILLITIYIIFSIFKLLKQPTNTFVIENGKVSFEESAIGYIIRQENIVQGQNYKNGISIIKSEGEKVAKDESVFRYYTSGEEELKNKIQELDGKINEAQAQINQKDIFSSDIKLLDKEVDNILNEVYTINNRSKIEEYKKNIIKNVTKKTKISGDLSPAGSYLKKLIDERSGYENQLNSGSEYVKAPVSGVVSYKIDGLESVLTPDKFSTFSESLFDGFNLKTGQIISSSNEKGKIVNNFKCYIATIINKEKLYDLKLGDTIQVRLSNSKEIPVKVTYIEEKENNKVLLVVETSKEVEELINYRKISFDIIFWTYQGFKVPNSAIIKENNLAYVIRNRAGYKDKILVKIKKENEDYSIIGNYEPEELKNLGFDLKDIKNNKNILLYDEVFIKANLQKLK